MLAIFHTFENSLILTARIERTNETIRCLRLEKTQGDRTDFLEIYNEIRVHLREASMILNE